MHSYDQFPLIISWHHILFFIGTLASHFSTSPVCPSADFHPGCSTAAYPVLPSQCTPADCWRHSFRSPSTPQLHGHEGLEGKHFHHSSVPSYRQLFVHAMLPVASHLCMSSVSSVGHHDTETVKLACLHVALTRLGLGQFFVAIFCSQGALIKPIFIRATCATGFAVARPSPSPIP